MKEDNMVQLAINTIRTLSMDAVQQAKSGHPGTPMALAPLLYTIWNRLMQFDPQDPIWPNRDRFVLSNGHASMLLWSALHLTGVQAVNATTSGWGSLGDPRRHPPVSATRQQSPRTPRNTIGSPALKPLPARLARALLPAWGWPSLRNGSPPATTGRPSTFSITASLPSAAMAA